VRLAAFQAGKETHFSQLRSRFEEEKARGQVRSIRMQQNIQWVAIAAAVIILAVIAIPRLIPSEIDLQEQYFAYAILPSAPDTKSGEQDSLIATAHFAFNQKDYTQATATYEQILADSGYVFNAKVHLYLGLSYLSEGKTADARSQFEKCPTASPEYMDASWFHALSYLKEENVPELKKELNPIAADQQHFYQQKAKKLLDVLK